MGEIPPLKNIKIEYYPVRQNHQSDCNQNPNLDMFLHIAPEEAPGQSLRVHQLSLRGATRRSNLPNTPIVILPNTPTVIARSTATKQSLQHSNCHSPQYSNCHCEERSDEAISPALHLSPSTRDTEKPSDDVVTLHYLDGVKQTGRRTYHHAMCTQPNVQPED